MTILELAARLDDYSGTLALMVQKLQIERTRGALSRDEELDLVQDLREALDKNLIHPRQVRAGWALGAALLILASWLLLPGRLAHDPRVGAALALLALAALLLAGYQRWTVGKLKAGEGAWLQRAEEAVKAGGTVFDVR